eukprot:4343925-Prymnesium_polylepis.1
MPRTPATESFATGLQKSRTPSDALHLAATRKPGPAQSVALLTRLVQVTPRGGGAEPLRQARA